MFSELGVCISLLMSSIAAKNSVSLAAGQMQTFGWINSYTWILIVLVFILAVGGIYASKIYRRFPKWISSGTADGSGVKMDMSNDELYKAIETAGYLYNPKQDIFYSRKNAWQRNMGYCRLYDEAEAPSGMIVDCEPIYFEYDEKNG